MLLVMRSGSRRKERGGGGKSDTRIGSKRVPVDFLNILYISCCLLNKTHTHIYLKNGLLSQQVGVRNDASGTCMVSFI